MREREIREGDIVQIDASLEYEHFKRKCQAVVIWKGFNGQPLVTEIGKWSPTWETYTVIAEVIGHVDLNQAVWCQLKNALEEKNEP